MRKFAHGAAWVVDWGKFALADKRITTKRVPSYRIPPRLNDLHPEMRVRLIQMAIGHERQSSLLSLALICAVRSQDEQISAYKRGRSHIDGVKRFSLHQYGSSELGNCMAADVWIYMVSSRPDTVLYEYRPPKEDGAKLILMGPYDRVWPRYERLGSIGEDCSLEWGGRWPRLRDGVHFQLPRRDRIVALQKVLNDACGAGLKVDGIDGRKTFAAIKAAGRGYDVAYRVSWRQRRIMPLPPKLWNRLFEEARDALA